MAPKRSSTRGAHRNRKTGRNPSDDKLAPGDTGAARTGSPSDASELFEDTYSHLFGTRWQGLRDALEAPGRRHLLSFEGYPTYVLDPASVFAARLVGAISDHAVDLCAAPGGKTLVLTTMLAPTATLTANERSSRRRARLRHVLETHLPPEVRARVRVSGHDARRWGVHRPAASEAVLVDVPCSAERHLLNRPSELARWSPRRGGRLARDQYAMLRAALQAAKPGGRVVYATCALNPTENDGVIRRAIERGAERFTVLTGTRAGLSGGDDAGSKTSDSRGRSSRGHSSSRHKPEGESFPIESARSGEEEGVRSGTSLPQSAAQEVEAHAGELDLAVEHCDYGVQIMPDQSSGAGPLYAAVLRIHE